MSMMRKKMKVPPHGQLKDVEMVAVSDSKENWSEYYLSDGTSLRMKVVMTEVWRVVDEYDQEGNPIYITKSANVLTIIAAEGLRRPS